MTTMMVEPQAVVAAMTTFPFNMFAALKRPKNVPPPWQLFPLPHEVDATKLSRRKAARVRDLSVWEALGRLGRVYYSYADDLASEHLLVAALRQIYTDTTHTLPATDKLAIIRFAFTPHDLWEGEALYQFLQGLLITARDRANQTIERVITAILDDFYASYAKTKQRG